MALKSEISGWLSSRKLVAPKRDNIHTGRGMIEWRGRGMGFVMGLLGRYVMFTVAVFVAGGVMGYFFDGKREAEVQKD